MLERCSIDYRDNLDGSGVAKRMILLKTGSYWTLPYFEIVKLASYEVSVSSPTLPSLA